MRARLAEASPNALELEALHAEVAELRARLIVAVSGSAGARPEGSPDGTPLQDGDAAVGKTEGAAEPPSLIGVDEHALSWLNESLGRTTSALAFSEARYRAILDSSTDYAIIVTDLNGRVTNWNEGARRIMGWSEGELLGRSTKIMFTPEDVQRDRLQAEMRMALDEGRAADERWHLRKDGSRFWASGLLTPLRVEGEVEGFLKILRDRTQERETQENERLLAHELQHRVRNTLAMVQAIASQTFRESSTPASRDTFSKRIVALSQANEVLTRAGWTAAPIADIVTGATIPHCAGPERFTVSGPPIEIAARAALALTLALHELCTNASKYGALSAESGHVTIDWDVVEDTTFRLRWAERGGPAVSKPSRKGFGTRLIEGSLGPQFDGAVRTDFDPEGLTCTFQAPLAKVQETIAAE